MVSAERHGGKHARAATRGSGLMHRLVHIDAAFFAPDANEEIQQATNRVARESGAQK
jgi:hypothetical protein